MSQGLLLFIGIFLIVLVAALLVFIIYWRGLTNAVFFYCFKRTSPDRWDRGKRSDPARKDLYQMWEAGVDWMQANKEKKSELETVNGKEQLAAQYYDFGNQAAVIIVPGMYESSTYSSFYAEVWKNAGFNVLLPDNRATGNSGGDYNSIGLQESEDLINWAEVLHTRHGIRNVVLHGISMGASVSLLALSLPTCPPFLSGAVCDGAYFRFEDFFKNFMIQKRYNPRVLKSVLKKLTHVTGADPESLSPSSFIDRIDVPVLFLAGKKDALVTEAQTQELYASCGSADKDLVWFENGEHSFLRYTDTGSYDQAIDKFIKERLIK